MPRSTPASRPPASPAGRFRTLFGRDPTPDELTAFSAARAALVLRLPRRARREAARVIARL